MLLSGLVPCCSLLIVVKHTCSVEHKLQEWMQQWEGEAVAFIYMGCVWWGALGSRGDKGSLDLKQTDRRNGGSRCLDADATAEERQGRLENISKTVQSTLLARTRPAELPWKLATGHT